MPHNLLKPVSDAMADRLRNPVYFTFILAWSASNWYGLFLLFFGEDKASNRVDAFVVSLNWWNAVFAPGISTLALLILMPWIAGLIEKANAAAKNYRVDLRLAHREHEIDEEIKIAAKEARLLRLKNENTSVEEMQKELDEAKLEIKTLEAARRGERKDFEASLSTLEKDIAAELDTIYDRLTPSERVLKDFTARNGIRMMFDEKVDGIHAGKKLGGGAVEDAQVKMDKALDGIETAKSMLRDLYDNYSKGRTIQKEIGPSDMQSGTVETS